MFTGLSSVNYSIIQITFEALFALVIGTLGAILRAPALREITWRSEMKRRYVEVRFSVGGIIERLRTDS